MFKNPALVWLIAAAAGLTANLFALRMGEAFAQYRLPLFFPPVWLLPAGWVAALIIFAAAFTGIEEKSLKLTTAFYVALGLMICWAVLFFRAGLPAAAAVSGLTLTGVLLHMRRLAGDLRGGRRFVPCCVWAGYLAYLNLGICLMN
jgi:tryptophan-rich sensory protein